jgi:hypothetical protein
MRLKLIPSILIVMALIVSVGCGSGSNSTPPPVVSISQVSPSSATVRPGQTQQFSATVTGSSNTAITWSIGSGQGTISSSGLYTAPSAPTVPASVTVTATAQADTSKSNTAAVTLVALQSLAISPRSPAITVGGATGTVTFAATGTFSDGATSPNLTKADWTAQSTWTSSNGDVTIASGTSTATGAAVGVATVTATDAVGGTISDSTAVNVTGMNMGLANLHGSYAFAVTHADARGMAFAIGSFVADGNGTITSGIEETSAAVGNFPPGGLTFVAGSGCNTPSATGSCYTVYPDGRGVMSIALPGNRGTNYYSFILSSDGPPSTKGKFMQSDIHSVTEGSIELQTTADFATGLSGSYAMLLGGMDGTLCTVGICAATNQNPIALAGQFATASGGNINGVMDVNDSGTINGTAGSNASALAFTATLSGSVDLTTGRGTLVLTLPSALSTLYTGPWNFVYYMVSANKVFLMQTDVQTNPLASPPMPALAGIAEQQSSTNFGNADLLGNYVFLIDRSASSGVFGGAGQLGFAAANALSGEFDIYCPTTCTPMTAKTYTLGSSSAYTNVTTYGRATAAISAAPAGSTLSSAVVYLVSSGTSGSGKMYVLETDGKTNGGVAKQQSTPFSLPTGVLGFSLNELAVSGFDSSYTGQIDATSPASLTGIVDSNIAAYCGSNPPAGTSCIVSQAGTLLTGAFPALSAVDLYGRGVATLALPLQTPSNTYGFYLVSPTKMVVFGTGTNVPAAGSGGTTVNYQPVDGVIENQ